MFKKGLAIIGISAMVFSGCIAAEFNGRNSVSVAVQISKEVTDLQNTPNSKYEKNLNAEDQANNWINSKQGFHSGWNEDKEVFLAIGIAMFDTENPSYDDSFIIKRQLNSMSATLDAKAQIIEYINTKMSAFDRATIAGTDLNARFKDEIDKLEKKMEAQKRVLISLAKDSEKKEAEVLKGVTLGDRMKSLMDAIIKKLDKEYSVKKIEEKKIKKFQKAKRRYYEALKDYNNIKKQIEATHGQITEELQSKVEALSKMPLFGAAAIAQFESYDADEERYYVAIVTLWSKNNEKLVRSFLKGKTVYFTPGKQSLEEWLNENHWETATGGRIFTDNRGKRYFIGIAASPVGKSSSSERRARGVAAMMAKKEVVTSVFSDIESYKAAEQMMQTRSGGNGKDNSIAMESFAKKLRQSIKNRSISGIQKFFGKKLIHPISQQKIYVAIYGVDADSAKSALMMQESNYMTSLLDAKFQQKLKAKKDALEESRQRAKEDKTTYYNEKAKTSFKVENSTRKENIKTKTKNYNRSNYSYKNNNKPSRSKPKSSGYQGAGAPTTFDW